MRISISCENKRTMEIFSDLGMRRLYEPHQLCWWSPKAHPTGGPLVLIRFNPDDYIDVYGNKIKSCFSYHNANGLPMISSKNKKSWEYRMNELFKVLECYIVDGKSGIVPSSELTHVNLFYDAMGVAHGGFAP